MFLKLIQHLGKFPHKWQPTAAVSRNPNCNGIDSIRPRARGYVESKRIEVSQRTTFFSFPFPFRFASSNSDVSPIDPSAPARFRGLFSFQLPRKSKPNHRLYLEKRRFAT